MAGKERLQTVCRSRWHVMYSLCLRCTPEQVEELSSALWEAGTVGIRESDGELLATFEDAADRNLLSSKFANHALAWEREEDTDWIAATQHAWPGRELGERIFLAPMWNQEKTPEGRVRVVHNPGQASGTGEHPCTQLALESVEKHITAGSAVVDLGTGSGLLGVAAMRLGARVAVGLDVHLPSLEAARENYLLNEFWPFLVGGSADCLASESADLLVANISGSVLLDLADEMLRILRPGGWLILTGFPESELDTLRRAFGEGEVTGLNEWRCLSLRAG